MFLSCMYMYLSSEDGVEDNMEAQEILEDQLARQLTREYIDLLGKSRIILETCWRSAS